MGRGDGLPAEAAPLHAADGSKSGTLGRHDGRWFRQHPQWATARLLVCRERSIVRGDEGRIMTRPSSRPEARSLLGYQTANELGAPVASSIPAQLPGHEPASARMGYEDGHALFLRY